MLKYTEKRVIDDTDWDDFVKSVYKRPYKFQQQDGCKSRGIYSFSVPPRCIEDRDESYDSGVPFDEWINATPPSDMEHMHWERNFFPDVTMIIDDLYKKGLIESGNYIININW